MLNLLDEIAELKVQDLLDLQGALAVTINSIRRKKGLTTTQNASAKTTLDAKVGSILTRDELSDALGVFQWLSNHPQSPSR